MSKYDFSMFENSAPKPKYDFSMFEDTNTTKDTNATSGSANDVQPGYSGQPLDIGKPADNIVTSGMPEVTQNLDTTSTEPTSVALGLGTVENPKYLSENDMTKAKQQEYTKASEEGNIYIDPQTGENKGMPLEPSLADASLEVLPIGKLGFRAGNVAFDYDKIGKELLSKGSTLSKEANALLKLNQGRITDDEAISLLSGVKKEDQVKALANRLHLAKNYYGKAVGQDSEVAAKLGKGLEKRKAVIDNFAQREEDVKVASDSFGAMREEVNSVPGKFTTESLNKDIEYLDEIYASDQSSLGTLVRQIKADINGDTISAGDAIAIRQNVNEMLRKTSIKNSFKATDHLNKIKQSLTKFIDNVVPSELATKIKTETTNYSNVINNYQLGELIAKHTKADYAVDWAKLIKDIKKEGLHSDNLNKAIPIIKEFEKRFHNDKYLGTVITPDGARESEGLWTIVSGLVGAAKDAIWTPLFNKSRNVDLMIQKALRKSIMNSETSLDFIKNIKADKSLPQQTKDTFVNIVDEGIKAIEYKKKGYRASKDEFKVSKGALGEGTYYFDSISKANERKAGTKNDLFERNVDWKKLATKEDIAKLLGKKPSYKDIRNNKKLIQDAGFIGVQDNGEFVIY